MARRRRGGGGSGAIRIEVGGSFDQWMNGLGDMEVTQGAREEWDFVTETFFDRTQRVVHVISGNLKRSGRIETRQEGDRISTEVQYGGVMGTQGPVDYAAAEAALGGSHDFIGRAYASMAGRFQEGVGKAAAEMIRQKIGGR
jgi:hypothetical protein